MGGDQEEEKVQAKFKHLNKPKPDPTFGGGL